MNIIVTGANGQLGRDLVPMLRECGYQVEPLNLKEVDFSHPEEVETYFAAAKADWVINCAAYTQVDNAEEDQDAAFLINRDAVGSLARGVSKRGARLIHISTDYVFDGENPHPYLEEDDTNPQSVYGRSKLAGEKLVRQYLPQAAIVRTAWLYGAKGRNFVTTILNLAKERETLKVVDDQFGTPTWTKDLAKALIGLIRQDVSGTFHFTNEGVASWYDFAFAIVEEARYLGYNLRVKNLIPVDTAAFPRPATRPTSSILHKESIREALGYGIPHWRDGLRKMLEELKGYADG